MCFLCSDAESAADFDRMIGLKPADWSKGGLADTLAGNLFAPLFGDDAPATPDFAEIQRKSVKKGLKAVSAEFFLGLEKGELDDAVEIFTKVMSKEVLKAFGK